MSAFANHGDGILPPKVSVVIPCRNAARVIATCLDSLVASDYPKDRLEVRVVDGMSDDGTRAVVTEYGKRFPFIVLERNPKTTQQSALNIGIRGATGDVIIRMDAHTSFVPSHISQCVTHLLDSGADTVGGRLMTVPREDTVIGRAIAIAMSERFGVGNSPFRIRRDPDDLTPRWVDTVPYACYRRTVFERVGLFNEHLDRSEDAEFHRRMKEAGCRTLFVPSLVSYYHARSDLKSFWLHAVDNGRWAVLPTRYTGRLEVSLRHLVPLGFVSVVGALAVLALFKPEGGYLLAAVLVAYGLVNLAVSAGIAMRERDARLAVVLPVVFSLLHVGYGLGSFGSLGTVAASRWPESFLSSHHAK